MINRRLGKVQSFLILFAVAIGLHVHADVSAPLPPEPVPGQPGVTPAPVPAPTTNAVPLPVRPQVPDALLKTSTSPDNNRIDDFINKSVERMVKGTDTTTVSDARSDLIAGSANPSPQSPASDLYLGRYTQTLAKSLSQEWAKATLNQRVNFGIIATRVAENAVEARSTGSLAALHKLIIKALQDPSPAIALWGMKAAAAVMNATPGSPSQDLLNQVIPCVQKHAYSGPVTDEAYSALSDSSAPVIAALMQLYKERTGLYANGIPSDPAAEHKAAGRFVAGTGMWGKMSPQEQNCALALIWQNLDAALKAVQAPDTSPETAVELKSLIADTAKAVIVAAQALGDKNLEALARVASKIDSSTSPIDVGLRAQPLVDAMKGQYTPCANLGNPAAPAAVAKP